MTTRPEPAMETLPRELRGAVLAELQPVSPLPSPLRRAFTVAVPALAAIGVTAVGLAVGAHGLGLLAGALSLLEWLCGLGLVVLALREAIPGRSVGAGRAALALGAALLVQVGVAVGQWRAAAAAVSSSDALRHAGVCFGVEGMLGVAPGVAVVWLALRALPLAPGRSGWLAGAAAGLFADALWQLVCTRRELSHLMLGHLGAVVALTVVGAVVGGWMGRRRDPWRR